MRKRLLNKFMMFKAVQSLMNEHSDIWESIPAVETTLTSFGEVLNEIELCELQLLNNQKGLSLLKAAQQTVMISHTYVFASLLFAFAVKTGDAILKNKVDFSETALVKQRDTQLVITCTQLVGLVRNHLSEMTDYGVNETELDELDEKISLFDNNLPSGRVLVSERKAANEKLTNLIAEGGALLKDQLDRLMVRFREKDSLFYQTYMNSRRIMNYGIRHEKPKNQESSG